MPTIDGDYKFIPTHPTYEELEAEVERLRVHSERQSGTIRDLIKRAEAAEAEVERLRDWQLLREREIDTAMTRAEAEVERLREAAKLAKECIVTLRYSDALAALAPEVDKL